MSWPKNSGLLGDIGKRSIMIIVKQRIVSAVIGDIEIGVTIVVVIGRGYRLSVSDKIGSGGMGDIPECAISIVQKELVGAVFISDVQIQKAIIVDVGPHGGLSACGLLQPGLFGDVGEGSIPVIAKQRLPLREFPTAAEDQDIQITIVVVVGLKDIEPSELAGKPGLRAPV